MLRILHFGNDDGREYVVLTEGPAAEDGGWSKPGFKLINTIDTDADSGTLPLESVLMKED